MIILFGLYLGFTANAQETFLTEMEAATHSEDFCLVSAYFDEVSLGKTSEQSKTAALDSCVKPGTGRLGYVAYMADKFEDSPVSDSEAAQLKKEIRGYGAMALNLGVIKCESNRSSKADCLVLLKLN